MYSYVGPHPPCDFERQHLGGRFHDGDERFADGQSVGRLQLADDSVHCLPELVQVAKQGVEPVDFRLLFGRVAGEADVVDEDIERRRWLVVVGSEDDELEEYQSGQVSLAKPSGWPTRCSAATKTTTRHATTGR